MKVAAGAIVEGAEIGARTRIWAGAHILPGARVGSDCNIGEHCFIENEVVIGNGVVIKNGVSVWNRVSIGNHVFIGPAAVFTNDRAPRAHPAFRTGPQGWAETIIQNGASIGANATIVCGVTVGAWAMVAAGAVVTADVAPFELVVGVPATRRGHVCCCGRVLGETLACSCGISFVRRADDSVRPRRDTVPLAVREDSSLAGLLDGA